MMSQANAVVVASVKVLGDRFQKGVDIKTYASTDDRQRICAEVIRMFNTGETGFAAKPTNDEKKSDPAKLANYVIGLVNNHWRKHKLLNGGVEYEPKTKRGAGGLDLDALIKAA